MVSVKRHMGGFWEALLLGGGGSGARAETSQDGDRARYDALFQTMLERPADLDVMFEFAALAARLGEHDAATSTLERMLTTNPELPPVRLHLVAPYMPFGAHEMAMGSRDRTSVE